VIRSAPLLAIPFLIGFPIWIEPSWSVGLMAVAVAAFSSAGLGLRSLGLAAIGGVLSLICLTYALWRSSLTLSVFGALLFGFALLLLADGVFFLRRFDGANVDPSTWRRQSAWWIRRAAVSTVAGVCVTALASIPTITPPPAGRPILMGVGVLTTFASVMRYVWTMLLREDP
jgi:hypothetical protein